ncbi:cold-shock protein [Kitasatospora sp. CB01950]|uniref:cold-shock protein n=1 Tax=Kitasatospora sp. CB01950 TaxID=1703930 RepID=UPI00093F678F|nr:cold shock domain-containing protein [Kitasatospora sp. CB01950]OKI97211.1 hypothetical protein AMK19_32380 [Kitasatospora sp. CB01950]
MVAGRVVRFDSSRGYGFIAPDHGGEDVFLHVNDLLIPEASLRTGLTVDFEIEEGDRGPKASSVRLTAGADNRPLTLATAGAVSADRRPDDDSLCDVLTREEYLAETTDALLESVPSLTGSQILQVRLTVLELAKTHGWIS